jgi:hypothetical protein
MTFVILFLMHRLRLSSGDFDRSPRSPGLVQPTLKARHKAGAKHIQDIKDNFFSDESLRLFSTTVNTAANQLEGFSYQGKGRQPVHCHSFDLTFGLLERVEKQLLKLAHKPLMKSLTAQEKEKLNILRKESRDALAKIVQYKLPEGEIDSSAKTRGDTISGVSKTHLNSSSIPGYERRLKHLENGNIGDTTDDERNLLHAASDFNEKKSSNLREALEIPLEQMKSLAHKVWFKLNQVFGEKDSNAIVKELYKRDLENAALDDITSLMKQTLSGRVDLSGARQSVDRLYQDLKHNSHQVLTYSRAKVIAALKFARIFLQSKDNREALPESILVQGDKFKLFDISRTRDLPELNQIGIGIQAALAA